jgi:hypothetical protein
LKAYYGVDSIRANQRTSFYAAPVFQMNFDATAVLGEADAAGSSSHQAWRQKLSQRALQNSSRNANRGSAGLLAQRLDVCHIEDPAFRSHCRHSIDDGTHPDNGIFQSELS